MARTVPKLKSFLKPNSVLCRRTAADILTPVKKEPAVFAFSSASGQAIEMKRFAQRFDEHLLGRK
jgi:hypothetical protein